MDPTVRQRRRRGPKLMRRRMPYARELVGRRIVAFDPRPFPDGRGGTAHAPYITLDDGSQLRFLVEETDSALGYGIRILRVIGAASKPAGKRGKP